MLVASNLYGWAAVILASGAAAALILCAIGWAGQYLPDRKPETDEGGPTDGPTDELAVRRPAGDG